MYTFLVGDGPDFGRLAEALAVAFGVPRAAVDVAADGVDDRAWDSAVLCTVDAVVGDVSAVLDISTYGAETAAAAAGSACTEVDAAELAGKLAAELRTVVLFAAVESIPSAYRLATPQGLVTRIRLSVSADEPCYTIDAVADAVPELPSVPVLPMPEVIREQRMATPIRDRLEVEIGAIGGGTVRAESFDAGGDLWFALTRLGTWETLVARIAAGWPPDGRYPAEYYREDLKHRDSLELVRECLTGEVARLFDAALSEVDTLFVAHSVADDGAVLAACLDLGSVDLRLRGWWWQRVPNPNPNPNPDVGKG